MTEDNTGTTGAQSRRELLKKLGAGAGALVWATPVVQTISTRTAWAQSSLKAGCHAISHLDLVIKKDGQGPYGIQWDPSEGWSKHSTSQKHCLANDTWTQPTASSFFSGFPTPTKKGDNYEVTFPSSVQVLKAYSKAGQGCAPATSSGGKWTFTPWCEGTTTTTTAAPTTTTTQATTTTTSGGGTSGGGGSGCHAISHLDLVVKKGTSGAYGIQWDPGAGWGAHPTSSKHCLAPYTWTQPSSSLLSEWPTPVKKGDNYELTVPSGWTVEQAFSKAGQECAAAVRSGSKLTFTPWCPPGSTTTTSSTTSTTQPTTTTTAPKGGSGSGSDSGDDQCDVPGGGGGRTGSGNGSAGSQGSGSGDHGTGCEGSPQPGKDISHMDFILCRSDNKTSSGCTKKYGVQYDFGGGWGAHPTGGSNEHCLQGLSKERPPSNFSYQGFGSAISIGGGSFKIGLPADVTVWSAFSKCGQICRPATYLGYSGGKKWYQFDPC